MAVQEAVKKPAILKPIRSQERVVILLTYHTSDPDPEIMVEAARIHARDSFGNELPQPIQEPLTEIEAFERISRTASLRLTKAIQQLAAAQKEEPKQTILTP